MTDSRIEPTGTPTPGRPADFAPSSSAVVVRILVVVAFLVFVGLRVARPIEEAVASHGRDHIGVFFAFLTPALVLAILLALVAARVSPFVRARRLRSDHPDALVTTGQWSRETAVLMPGLATVNQFTSYSLVIDRQGLAFYNGLFRGEVVHRIAASDMEWVNSQMVTGWKRTQRGLRVTTRSGPVPLLIIAFSNPVGMFPTPSQLTRLAEDARRQLGLSAPTAP